MPPKPISQTKLPDVKVRKITDFWPKSDAGSSPMRSQQATSERVSSSSPTRQNATNRSTPVPNSKQGELLFPQGAVGQAKGLTMNNVGPSRLTPSPRKFIIISSDEEEQDLRSNMSASKKRPRETPPPAATSFKLALAIDRSAPEIPTSSFIDLTASPPKKRRVTETLRNGTHSRTVSSGLSANSSYPEFSPITPLSSRQSTSEPLDTTITSNGASTSFPSFTETTTAPFSSTDTSIDSNLPVTAPSMPPKLDPVDKARSRIEEIRRMAEAREKEAQIPTTLTYQPMLVDDSDEEDDILEKLIPFKKAPIPVTPKKASGSAKVLADPFGSTSPLTEVGSDSSSEEEPIRPTVMTRSRSRAASMAPEDPAPARPRSRATSKAPTRASSKAPTRVAPSKLRASSKPPAAPLPPTARAKKPAGKLIPPQAKAPPPNGTMPPSLASLLADSPSKNRRRDDPKTLAFINDVKRDMQEIEQRQLYGGTIEFEPQESTRNIDPSVTEKALGEEDGRRMNEVIASDNAAAAHASPWRPFWDEQLVGARDVTMDVGYQIPRLSLSPNPHPILASLQRLVSNHDTSCLALFLSSGILATIPTNNEDGSLVPWLFRLSCEASDDVATAAQQALHTIISTLTKSYSYRYQLVFSHLLEPILALGPLKEAVASLRHSGTTISPPRDPITRNAVVNRLVSTIKMARGMICQSPEDVTLLLLLLYLDPSTSTDVRRDISLVVEDIILSIADNVGEKTKELVICKKIVETTASFRLAEKRMLLDCIFGGQPGPRRFMRWIAFGFLLPEAVHTLDWATYLEPPPLSPLADMLSPALMATSPFRVYSKTDYYDFHHRVDILGTILTDIRLYGAKEDSNVERIIVGLDSLHGKIVDARAAFIERTRAKDALQRLRFRVHFQFQRTVKRIATIDNMLKR